MLQRLLQTRLLLDCSYIASGAIVAQSTAYAGSIYESKLWLGLSLPHWVGWLMFILALLFGSVLSVHQKTAVDDYIAHPKLKPFYSLGFGFFVTVFGIPLKYPQLTIFELILPAVGLAAIGSQVIYYLIAFFTSPELWAALKIRAMNIAKGGRDDADPTK